MRFAIVLLFAATVRAPSPFDGAAQSAPRRRRGVRPRAVSKSFTETPSTRSRLMKRTQVATTATRNADAAGLEQFKTLVDELGALNKAAQAGTASTKTLQKGYVATVVPLENAARKNPYNAEYEYGELIAQKITADAAKLKAAGTVDDAAPLLQKLVESTDAYCQTLNCGNLLIYR